MCVDTGKGTSVDEAEKAESGVGLTVLVVVALRSKFGTIPLIMVVMKISIYLKQPIGNISHNLVVFVLQCHSDHIQRCRGPLFFVKK